MRIDALPLAPGPYARYGDVIAAAREGERGREANQGTARRFDRLAELVDRRPGRASPNLSVFRCEPLGALPLEVKLLERHAHSTQLFVPMTARRYLVVVALGGDRPDLSTLAAFVASPAQGVTYRPGVWHHPMVALDRQTDFACLSWEEGTSADCDVVSLAPDERARVYAPAG